MISKTETFGKKRKFCVYLMQVHGLFSYQICYVILLNVYDNLKQSYF